jgi:predicted nucleic acid-binding protein
MSGNKKRGSSYYFDACIYLSYLRNESDVYGKDKIRAIEAVWNESESGGAAIVTSSITITEVLSNKLGAKEEKKFLQAVHKIHQLEDVTPPIAERARQYRKHTKRFDNP